MYRYKYDHFSPSIWPFPRTKLASLAEKAFPLQNHSTNKSFPQTWTLRGTQKPRKTSIYASDIRRKARGLRQKMRMRSRSTFTREKGVGCNWPEEKKQGNCPNNIAICPEERGHSKQHGAVCPEERGHLFREIGQFLEKNDLSSLKTYTFPQPWNSTLSRLQWGKVSWM